MLSCAAERSMQRQRTPPRRSPHGPRGLDAVFRPRSVAVVGASRQQHAIGAQILRNLIGFEFQGPVHPVNASAAVVQSMRCYRTLREIPGPVDLVVVVVPRDHVRDVVRRCGQRGVRAVVVITAGFKELGESGARLEAAIARDARRHGMRMVGPNCMGVINTEPSVRLNATFAATLPERGTIGFISQSGALGEAILADAAESGLGVAMFVSMGNKADVSANDLLEYWEHDDSVQAILMYLESFGNPRTFTQLARRITRRKPIVTVKAGRTAAGARAASSHTGSMIGLDAATDALLEQCGVLRVSTLE
jgi:acyl-CoA synthetase (NDP forming)